jgi:hypothetical protein
VAQEQTGAAWGSRTPKVLAHVDPVYTDGLQCRECGRIYRHAKRMQTHCRDSHAWTGRQHSSSRRKSAPAMWTTDVKCQKFHHTGHFGRLFEVGGSAAVQHVNAGTEGTFSVSLRTALSQIVADDDARQATENAAIQEDTDRYDFNEWLHRAGGRAI